MIKNFSAPASLYKFALPQDDEELATDESGAAGGVIAACVEGGPTEEQPGIPLAASGSGSRGSSSSSSSSSSKMLRTVGIAFAAGLVCFFAGVSHVAGVVRQPGKVIGLNVIAGAPVMDCLNLEGFRGQVMLPSDATYHESLQHNFKSINIVGSKPTVVAEATNMLDVQSAVRCARVSGLKVCARSGGGSFTGASRCSADPAMLLDLHRMKNLTYNSASGVVDLELGLTLGQALVGVDSQSGGRATLPVGLCSGIGVGGFLLGGGMGPLDGMAGLLCDRLQEVQMVAADGRLIKATREQNRDVLWAACGGGGQALGVVISASLSTFPTSEIGNSLCLRASFGLGHAPEVFDAWQSFAQDKSHIRFEIFPGRVILWGCLWQRGLHDLKSFSGRDRAKSNVDVSGQASATGILQDVGFRLSNTMQHLADAKLELLIQFDRFLDAQKLLGPAGGWGRYKAEQSDADALLHNQWFFAKQQDTRSEKTMLTGPLSPWSDGFRQMVELCGRGPGNGGWSVCTIIPVGMAVGRKASDETAFFWRSAKH